MLLCDISLLGRCWGTSRFTDVQPIFLDVDVYKWMLSSIPIEVEVEVEVHIFHETKLNMI